MHLFHATISKLELNQRKNACRRALDANKAAVDKEFDALKPSSFVPRAKALFGSDNPQFCLYYLRQECPKMRDCIHVYKIEMHAPAKHPIALVGYAQHFFNHKETLAEIIKEYWEPSQIWSCWEYISMSMTPVAVEPTPDGITLLGVKSQYSIDMAQAKRLWPTSKAMCLNFDK